MVAALSHWVLAAIDKLLDDTGGEGGDRGRDGQVASPTQWTWVSKLRESVKSGKPGVLQCMEPQSWMWLSYGAAADISHAAISTIPRSWQNSAKSQYSHWCFLSWSTQLKLICLSLTEYHTSSNAFSQSSALNDYWAWLKSFCSQQDNELAKPA